MKDARYLLVLPVAARRIDDSHFAIESAFAGHLRLLKAELGPLAHEMVVASPELDADTARNNSSLTAIDEAAENIRYVPMYPQKIGTLGYLRRLPRILRTLRAEVQRSTVLHSNISTLYRPFEIAALILAWRAGKTSISITDIDHRNSANMNLKMGRWNWKQYLVTKYLHYGYTHLQHLLVARFASLALFKGKALVDDYGRGRDNVKFILDAAYSQTHIIPADTLEAKLARLMDPQQPVELAYYGRLEPYKGIDHMLRAVATARKAGLESFRFHILGNGSAELRLKDLSTQLGLDDRVIFRAAMPYDQAFIELLYSFDVLLAAPLSEDTPRSALDAAACGQAVLAYDTYYYRELKQMKSGVETVPWPSVEAMATRLASLCRDRGEIERLIRSGIVFARSNTQEIWLQKRVQWTKDAVAADDGDRRGQ